MQKQFNKFVRMIIAETPRLIIRQFLPKEEEALVTLDKDKRLHKYVHKRSEADSRKVFKEALADYASGKGLSRWGIFYKPNNDFIGVCMLRPAKVAPDKIELGYRLHLKYWGYGIATEMAIALIEYGFVQMLLPQISAVTHPKNIASQRVLEKAGLTRLGEVFWYGQVLPYFEIKNMALAANL